MLFKITYWTIYPHQVPELKEAISYLDTASFNIYLLTLLEIFTFSQVHQYPTVSSRT